MIGRRLLGLSMSRSFMCGAAHLSIHVGSIAGCSSSTASTPADVGDSGGLGDAATDVADVGPRTPPVGVPVGTVDTFAEIGGGTEGIAFGADGALYVGSQDAIYRIAIDGVPTKVVDLKGPLGIALRADGDLLVCGKSDDAARTTMLWKVSPSAKSKSPLVASSADYGLFNFVAIAKDGSIVVTDSDKDKVYRAAADGTGFTLVTSAIDYANGMSFSSDGNTLFVASYNQKKVWSLAKAATPAPGYAEPKVYADGVLNVDGIVTMPSGDLLFVGGEGIVRWSGGASGAGGKGTTIVSGKVLKIAANGALGSGAFGEGWLYVSTLIGTTIERVYVGK